MDEPESWHDGLEGEALEIAKSLAKVLKVEAGPGTGKSRAIERRALRLLTEEKLPGSKILAVTLTKTAASDLRKKLSKLSKGESPIVALTLHSYCHRILSGNDVFATIGRVPRMLHHPKPDGYYRFEAEPMMADLDDPAFKGIREKSRMLTAFEAAWAREYGDEPFRNLTEAEEAFKHSLTAWLSFHEGMLVGELVPRTLEFISGNPLSDDIPKFEHVFVDEFQDLNQCEQELIEELRGEASVMIVGDADQSIYSFRYAKPKGLAAFEARHPDVKKHSLSECHRCPDGVVKPADALISKNYAKYQTRLVAKNKDRASCVRVRQWETHIEEAIGVAKWVQWLVHERGVPLSEILILCSAKILAELIGSELAGAGIAAQSYFSEKCFDDEPARVAFAYLTLLYSSADRVALRFLLGHGDQKWRKDEYKKLMSYCQDNTLRPSEVLSQLVEDDYLGVPTIVSQWKVISARLDQLADLNGVPLLDALFPETESWATEFRRMAENRGFAEFGKGKDLFEAISTEISEPSVPEGVDHVRLMSFYGSKGLTAQAVALAGCVQNLVPRPYNPNQSTLNRTEHGQEQRRLFYVALTRTTEYLLISGFKKMPKSVGNNLNAPGKHAGKENFSYHMSSFLTYDMAGKLPKPSSSVDFEDG